MVMHDDDDASIHLSISCFGDDVSTEASIDQTWDCHLSLFDLYCTYTLRSCVQDKDVYIPVPAVEVLEWEYTERCGPVI